MTEGMVGGGGDGTAGATTEFDGGNMMPAIDKNALGECRSVTITCISEIGWHDTDQMLADITV